MMENPKALHNDPKMALEVMQELKACVPQEMRSALLDTLGSLTKRDLLFYSLGKYVGHCTASALFLSTCGDSQEGA
jgi:hypothetical protein